MTKEQLKEREKLEEHKVMEYLTAKAVSDFKNMLLLKQAHPFVSHRA